MSETDYRVELDVFRGPLDLLLYLVKRDEVDIRDIPIAHIAEQFIHHLERVGLIDVERAGEFLVMAATLMEIKSKMLLPRPEEEEAGETADPRQELVRQLLEYKRFKDAAVRLEEMGEEHGRRVARVAVPSRESAGAPVLHTVELWDLVSAFGRLMRETLTNETQAITVDVTPLHVYTEMILEQLKTEPRLTLRALFTPPYTRGRLTGLFLAILELIRWRRIVAEQEGVSGDITFMLAPDTEEQGESEQPSGAGNPASTKP